MFLSNISQISAEKKWISRRKREQNSAYGVSHYAYCFIKALKKVKGEHLLRAVNLSVKVDLAAQWDSISLPQSKLQSIRRPRKDSRLGEPRAYRALSGIEYSTSG